ncbi:putative ammonium transporter 1 isoform X2 [Watersipora subatra]|uniref:putative ammonium transporter 1 isoform X2 n=1 Tax=Watersipora subatra TaxID=2589382 RepID=UPI00355B8DA7
MDTFFVLTVSMIIFLMQCGFAFLEAGAVRSKNTTNILLKNLLDSSVAGLSYYALGYAFAFGKGGGFIGGSGFFGSFDEDELSKWFFQMVFAATAATIVSGGVAERCEFIAYLTYSIVLTAFCYPVVTRWAWHSNGWLVDGSVIEGVAYQDFAGSGVVHVCGGVAALCGAVLLGPRIGRFNSSGKPVPIAGHSVPLAALGGFILMFGFFAFNGGSQFTISNPGDGVAVARAIVNTIISGSASGVTTILIHRAFTSTKRNCLQYSTWSLLSTINGILAGMVAICAGANVMQMWGALCTGIVAAFIYYFTAALVSKLRIDDPLDAVAVHGAAGTWGLIAAPLFDMNGILMTGSKESGQVLAMNLIGWLAIVAWTAVICATMFGILKALKTFRVSEDIELKGLDIPKHGEPAYPSEAWGDGWGEFLQASHEGLGIQRQSKLESAPVSVQERI